MSYSEQELHQVLIKLSNLMTAKISGNITPSSGDFDFLAQLRVYMDKVSKDNPKEQNDGTRIQAQLRSFLKGVSLGKRWRLQFQMCPLSKFL